MLFSNLTVLKNSLNNKQGIFAITSRFKGIKISAAVLLKLKSRPGLHGNFWLAQVNELLRQFSKTSDNSGQFHV